MPDLRTELKKLEALKFDDEGEPNMLITLNEPESLGVSATMFNLIRDNPAASRSRLISLASAAGIGVSSSSSLLTQFVKRGLVRSSRAEDGPLVYFSQTNTYKPGYVRKPKQVTAAKIPTAKVTHAVEPDVGVNELLNTMSIVKARALYDELKKIFGG